MKRPITGFGVDARGDPFAWLACGHRQHVRHTPPFTNRPWVLTAAGRRSQLGRLLDCARCDRCEMPEEFAPARRTPLFDELTVPHGLRSDHRTAAGVWGKILVFRGSLAYVVDGVARELTPARAGIVVAEQPHRVEPAGPVIFCVEFWRRRAPPDG